MDVQAEAAVTLRHAGVALRFVAFVIDAVILFALGYLIAVSTGETTEEGFELMGASALAWFVLAFAYYIVLEGLLGATVGKLLTGLRVRKEDGSRLDWPSSVVRNVMRIVDGIPFLLPYLLGAIFVWTSGKRQRLGDRVASTVVVRGGGDGGARA
jgi:uncharacterized RDD family membrane protein YckC